MRQDLERLLRDTTLTTLAFAIALGWTLYQVATGVATFITIALDSSESNPFLGAISSGGWIPGVLTWEWGNHVFVFQPILQGLIEFAVVLAVVLVVQRRSRRSTA